MIFFEVKAMFSECLHAYIFLEELAVAVFGEGPLTVCLNYQVESSRHPESIPEVNSDRTAKWKNF